MRPAILAARPAVGGGDGYTASAAHFDGATYLTNSSLVASTAKALSFVCWFKTTQNAGEPTLYVVDPDNSVVPYISMPNGKMGVEMAADPNPAQFEKTTNATFKDGSWHPMVFSIDSSTAAPFQSALYIDDTKITDFGLSAHPDGNGSAFIPLGDGLKTQIGFDDTDSSGFYIGDLADYRIFYGVSLLDGSGNISQANRRLFVDGSGKPVDPATAVASLGTPTIQFTGAAASFGTNAGSGGAFTTTGTLTDASTHP